MSNPIPSSRPQGDLMNWARGIQIAAKKGLRVIAIDRQVYRARDTTMHAH